MEYKVKVRVAFPDGISASNSAAINRFVDDVLLWSLETELQVEHYKNSFASIECGTSPSGHPIRKVTAKEAVFIIESKDAFMFVLRWGAQMKNKSNNTEDSIA